MYVWIIILLVSLTIVHPVVHNWYPHACKHFVPGVCIVLDSHAQLTVYAKCIFCLRKMCIHSLVKTTFIFSIIHVRVTEWLSGPRRLLYVCVDSICDCSYVWLICGWMYFLSVCCSFYMLYACMWVVLRWVWYGKSGERAELRDWDITGNLTFAS